MYEKNKEEILGKKKQFRESNREQIREKASEIITSECGDKLRRGGLNEHNQTQKHAKNLLALESQKIVS